ncbi:hypothetical protein ACOSQ4_004301 [Xanthoceras sorbifolium]
MAAITMLATMSAACRPFGQPWESWSEGLKRVLKLLPRRCDNPSMPLTMYQWLIKELIESENEMYLAIASIILENTTVIGDEFVSFLRFLIILIQRMMTLHFDTCDLLNLIQTRRLKNLL